MKYITEFRNRDYAKLLSQKIHEIAEKNKKYHIMEFCGGHTHAIYRYGIPDLLPNNVKLIHGPGCPVCVLPIARVDYAIAIAQQPNVILCSYGDMLRVPGSHQTSLLTAKAKGADVRMVYSIDAALQIAEENLEKQVVFFAIGFETTTPPTAAAIKIAKIKQLKNFSVFCNHVLTPPALFSLLSDQNGQNTHQLDGFIGPAHVSIVIGCDAYGDIAHRFQKPIVVSGFEPLDIMQSIFMLIKQINANHFFVENQYIRAVTAKGNQTAQALMADVFSLASQFEWRGLGLIPNSALQINLAYQEFDAEKRFSFTSNSAQEHKHCECGAVLRGQKKPTDCKLFSVVCTPANPLGSCMVSSEGACAAVYSYANRGQRYE